MKWSFPNLVSPETSYSAMHGGHAQGATKVVSDREQCIDKDWSEDYLYVAT